MDAHTHAPAGGPTTDGTGAAGGAGGDAAVLDLLGQEVPSFSLAMLRASPDCVKLLTPEGRVSFMSVNGMCAMAIPSFDNVRGMIWWELWPEGARATLQAAVAEAAQGRVSRFTADCPTAAGEMRSWDVIVSPIDGPETAPTTLLAISRDVTGGCAVTHAA